MDIHITQMEVSNLQNLQGSLTHKNLQIHIYLFKIVNLILEIKRRVHL